MLKIAHASDIQTRVFKRHKEFRLHFNNFYESLKREAPDEIVLTGDIIHDKTHVSPELFDMEVDFFNSLLKIAPVHVVPGNHDGNLNNLSRLDSLTPIFKAIDNDNLYYYKKSGIYNIREDVDFVVFSCFDDESKWPTKENINNNQVNIGLFHGMVQGAKLQNGQIVEEHPYKLKNFLNIVDYLLLGDIHQMQFLDLNYRAAYAGSLIQQNYAESIDKGYLLWKIESKRKHSVNFVKLPSVCPFYTVQLPEDLSVPFSEDFQKNARIRVLSRSLTTSEKKKIQEDLKFKYEPSEIIFIEEEVEQKEVIIDENSNLKAENLEDEEVQERLFKNFLFPYNLSDELVKEVLELNKKYHAKSKTEEDIKRNVQFKIGKMEFHNMFSYGEDNFFDFSQHKGIVGIFGKNAVGKSSLVVDIPLYILSNKISKKGVVKNNLLINEHKDNCGGTLEIMLDNDKYIVSRSTSVYTKSGKNKGEPILQGKTEVDFRCFRADQTEEDKNGEQRDDTDVSIRQVFGSPDDFMATSIAPQWELLGLIAAGGTKRQELIGRYFDIDIFGQKNELAKEDLKLLKAKIKIFEAKNIDLIIQNSQEALKKAEEEILACKTKFIDVKGQILEVSKKIQTTENKVNQVADWTNLFQHDIINKKKEFVSLSNKISNMMNYPCLSNPNCCLQEDLKDNKAKKTQLENEIIELNRKIEENKKQLEEYNKNKKDDSQEKLLKELERAALTLERAVTYHIEQVGGLKRQIEAYQKEKQEYLELKKEYEIYDYFLLATSRDGISKSIISKNLNIVNSQIKRILSLGVNFDIELVSDDDGKAIEILFKHERSKPRRIELCSGMEKTLTAIALRAALVSITTLPRSNIFVLDEVFSSLDPEYVDAATKMLEYLKGLFDSVIIITHLDTFKDICDHSVEISRNDEGYSRIVE